MKRWIVAGTPRTPADAPKLLRVTVAPTEVVAGYGHEQPLRVTAHYTDGSAEDVTRLAGFQSNESGYAAVDANGVGRIAGEATVTARFVDQFAVLRPATGTYQVRLFAFPAQPDRSILYFGSDACAYRLTLTTGGYIDAVTPLLVERGKPATLALRGWNLPVAKWALKPDENRFHPDWSATGGAIVREPHP